MASCQYVDSSLDADIIVHFFLSKHLRMVLITCVYIKCYMETSVYWGSGNSCLELFMKTPTDKLFRFLFYGLC